MATGYLGGDTRSGVLEGEYNASGGEIEWLNGWSTPVGAVTTDMLLDGTDLYITTTGSGLLRLDATTGDLITDGRGTCTTTRRALPRQSIRQGTEQLIIGLLGSATTASGVQSFDLRLRSNSLWPVRC